MLKKILVPVDFSKCSLDALKLAARAAKKSKGEICLLHVIQRRLVFITGQDPVFYPPSVDENIEKKYYKVLVSSSEKKMSGLVRASFLKGLKVSYKINIGFNVYSEIVEQSRKSKSDMIIMGTKGLNGTKEILIGSNSQRVVRFSEIPVVVIPRDIVKIKRIVFASDFTKESYRIFPAVKEFASIFNARIFLLKINTYSDFVSTDQNIKLLIAFNKKFKHDYTFYIQNDYVKESGILEYANRINADMIAIGTHGRKGLARFFRGDIGGNIIRLTLKPVFVSKLKTIKQK